MEDTAQFFVKRLTGEESALSLSAADKRGLSAAGDDSAAVEYNFLNRVSI